MKMTWKIPAVFGAAAALVLGTSIPAQAATNTWYNADAQEWNIYGESYANYSQFSRTGTHVQLTGADLVTSGLAYLKVWHGQYATGQWQHDVAIEGPRLIGSPARGQFQWYTGGVKSYDYTRVTAKATDVRLSGTFRIASYENLEGLSADDLAALANSAETLGVDLSDYEVAAVDGGTRLLTAATDAKTVYTVLTSDSVAFSGTLAAEDSGARAATVSVSNPVAGVASQYVFTTEEHRHVAAQTDRLAELAPSVFVDTEFGNVSNAARSPQNTPSSVQVTEDGYSIFLSQN